MARSARVVAPGIPHHLPQRGNRRQPTFFDADEYRAYPWSSAAAHVAGSDDQLVRVAPLLALVGNWRGFLATGPTEDEVQELRRHERSGRPLGHEPFVRVVERTLGRTLRRGKPGPKRERPQ